MNSLFSIILKNIILLVLIIISIVFVFTKNIGFSEVRYLFLSIGVFYIFAACFEAFNLSSIKKETIKFTYFTDGFIAKRVIKITLFVFCGLLLYYSNSIIKYMAFLCFLIAITELVVTIWRYTKKLCFVALEDQTLIISTNKISTIKASEISKIETRHGLTFFVNLKNESITLRTDTMKEKEAFSKVLENWIITNHLTSKVALN